MHDRKYIISADDAGERLDRFLSEQRQDLSRSQIKRLIEDRFVLVNGKSLKAAYILKSADQIEISLPAAKKLTTEPQEIPLDIVFEDEYLIVVDKPHGIVVHPAAGNPDRTLVNALLFHCGHLSGIGAPLRPGIVHRLDKDTSGLIVMAKDNAAHLSLSSQFQERTTDRAYYAIVHDVPRRLQGTIKSIMGRHPEDRKRFSSITRHGKEAVTNWDIVQAFKHFALLRLKLQTGRTHQIRVHMKELGHPILGDPVYGSRRKLKQIPDRTLKEILDDFRRQALHAYLLGFTHPATGERLSFESALPRDFATVLDAIKRYDAT
jgi:23S rRNA pseudouridine1911/1915/1917 synthase